MVSSVVCIMRVVTSQPRGGTIMAATSLKDLYQQKLQLLLDAEQQGLDAMPQLAQRVQDDRLRDALERHRGQTQEQVQRLQQLLTNRELSGQRRECTSMRALIDEAQSTLANIEDPDTIDAFVIGAQQAIEHHEIAAYGTARTWAKELGYDRDADLLQRSLDEEGDADKQLTKIAERSVNERATRGTDREVGVRSGGHADRSQSGELGAGGGLRDVQAERGADQR
jgi:ferritin-like metal-binding protein YciE